MIAALRYLFVAAAALAAVNPVTIPRSPGREFRSEGLFEGGKDTKASLESVRLASHAKEGFERWVIDFSDDKVAPRFQVEYVKARKFLKDDGSEVIERPAKFVFQFRAIKRNLLRKEACASLVKKSRYVSDIVIYPPVEQGDMAMELVLKDDVRFAPFQPIEREGRLVLDLKEATD